ncbi:MAG: hypothetical protein Q9205_004241 [Flavoplaca limonia]
MQSAISFGSKVTKGAVKGQEVETTVPSVLTPVYFTVQVWRTAPVWLAATHPLICFTVRDDRRGLTLSDLQEGDAGCEVGLALSFE